jgi:EpsI family protein
MVPLSRPLAEFPTDILGQRADWRMVREGVIEQEDKDVLRADDYLTREYAASGGGSVSGDPVSGGSVSGGRVSGGPVSRGGSVNLFVAYFRSQRTGQTPHSPKNCLPGSGWAWSVADIVRIDIAGRQPIDINRYIVSKGERHAVVLYWYQSRDRVVASEYRAAIFTAWDALRYNRSDTELVRVVAPVTEAGVEFIRAAFSDLRRFLPLG